MILSTKLKTAIKRSEQAYELYLRNKRFFQALRIYRANKELHSLLEEYLYECEEQMQRKVCEYLFHLEDWLMQFEQAQTEVKDNSEEFAFERWEGAIPFPKDIVEQLKYPK